MRAHENQESRNQQSVDIEDTSSSLQQRANDHSSMSERVQSVARAIVGIRSRLLEQNNNAQNTLSSTDCGKKNSDNDTLNKLKKALLENQHQGKILP